MLKTEYKQNRLSPNDSGYLQQFITPGYYEFFKNSLASLGSRGPYFESPPMVFDNSGDKIGSPSKWKNIAEPILNQFEKGSQPYSKLAKKIINYTPPPKPWEQLGKKREIRGKIHLKRERALSNDLKKKGSKRGTIFNRLYEMRKPITVPYQLDLQRKHSSSIASNKGHSSHSINKKESDPALPDVSILQLHKCDKLPVKKKQLIRSTTTISATQETDKVRRLESFQSEIVNIEKSSNELLNSSINHTLLSPNISELNRPINDLKSIYNKQSNPPEKEEKLEEIVIKIPDEPDEPDGIEEYSTKIIHNRYLHDLKLKMANFKRQHSITNISGYKREKKPRIEFIRPSSCSKHKVSKEYSPPLDNTYQNEAKNILLQNKYNYLYKTRNQSKIIVNNNSLQRRELSKSMINFKSPFNTFSTQSNSRLPTKLVDIQHSIKKYGVSKILSDMNTPKQSKRGNKSFSVTEYTRKNSNSNSTTKIPNMDMYIDDIQNKVKNRKNSYGNQLINNCEEELAGYNSKIFNCSQDIGHELFKQYDSIIKLVNTSQMGSVEKTATNSTNYSPINSNRYWRNGEYCMKISEDNMQNIRENSYLQNTDQQIIIGENDDGEKCNLLNVEAQNGKFVITGCCEKSVYEEAHDKLWLVVRSLKNADGKMDYRMNRGDIIKLGRVKFKVKDYRIEGGTNPEDAVSRPHEEGPIDILTFDDESSGEACKFCFGEKSTMDNPLFSVCKCKGTMKFVHLLCLKSWIKTKLLTKTAPTLRSYLWKSFDCEICKSTYPFCVIHRTTKYDIVDVGTPESGSFLMLESLNKDKNASRIVHVIQPTVGHMEFKLGRGHDSHVRISDISVSRCHAHIKCKNDGYYLEDNNSKFGTLVLVDDKLEIEPQIMRAVQIGRTVISFQLKPQLADISKVIMTTNQQMVRNALDHFIQQGLLQYNRLEDAFLLDPSFPDPNLRPFFPQLDPSAGGSNLEAEEFRRINPSPSNNLNNAGYGNVGGLHVHNIPNEGDKEEIPDEMELPKEEEGGMHIEPAQLFDGMPEGGLMGEGGASGQEGDGGVIMVGGIDDEDDDDADQEEDMDEGGSGFVGGAGGNLSEGFNP